MMPVSGFWLRLCAVFFMALCCVWPAQAQAQVLVEPVVGLWRVANEQTGKTDALVRIYAVNGQLEGKLEAIFPAPGEDPDPRCVKCEGAQHNQPKRGLVFMWGFSKIGNEYTGGRVLDPNTGSVYRAKMSVSEDGEKLMLHGYIGIPLLGRSQTWFKAR
ncbi:MAG: DUF2147 domain-containing protein [Burkholderiaceae bacterium]